MSLSVRSHLRALLILLIFFSIAVVAFPVIIMRPFVQQKPALLTIALVIARWSFWLTVAAALAGLALVVRTWARRPERLAIAKNAVMVVAVAVLCVAVLASRVNVLERMFHPIGEAHFLALSQASVGANEMVMAVRIHDEAHAYPVLEMGYHHVVNDTVGNEPIAVTY